MIKNNNCANCGGALKISNSGVKAKCNFCGSEFLIERGEIGNRAIADKTNIVGYLDPILDQTAIHRILVSLMNKNPALPLDFFTNVTVTGVQTVYCAAYHLRDGNVNLYCSASKQMASVNFMKLFPYRDLYLEDPEYTQIDKTDCRILPFNITLDMAERDNLPQRSSQCKTERVYLSAYEIKYTYGNNPYVVWLSGDGKGLFYQHLPVDERSQEEYNNLHVAANRNLREHREPSEWDKGSGSYISTSTTIFALANLILSTILWFVFGYHQFTYGEVMPLSFLLSIPITIMLLRLIRRGLARKKLRNFEREVEIDRQEIKDAKTALAKFRNERTQALRQFIAERRGLAGVLREAVTANPHNAFPEI